MTIERQIVEQEDAAAPAGTSVSTVEGGGGDGIQAVLEENGADRQEHTVPTDGEEPAVAVIEPETAQPADTEVSVAPSGVEAPESARPVQPADLETVADGTEPAAVAAASDSAETSPAVVEDATDADQSAVAKAEVPSAAVPLPDEKPREVKAVVRPAGTDTKPPLKKIKKITKKKKKKTGATILGRIELPTSTIEAIKKAKEKKKPAPAVQRKPAEKKTLEEVHSAKSTTERPKKRGRAEPERGETVDEKARRMIKPKQTAFEYTDVEDDPLLQGVRISNWDRHYKRRRPVFRHGRGQRKPKRPIPAFTKKVTIATPVALKDLSQLIGVKAHDILVALMKRGVMTHINSMLNEESVLQIALDFNRDIEVVEKQDEEKAILEEVIVKEDSAAERNVSRPPIVTFLGHVDHGKTSLLDAIRKTNVVATEEGGITQHISAYTVKTASKQVISFLDTPGHKAFTQMRARGANATDIAVLVVAADDGVMPQTEEAIQHARAAEVPIVVAINKVDKPNANTQRVKQQLAGLNIMTEDWGGEVGCVEVSAIKGLGLEELLERIILEAELLELKAHPERRGTGVVIESRKDEEVGNIVTLLVTDGSLHVRDSILAGDAICRVRSVVDDKGRKLEEAGASMPVNVIGFESLPESGEIFHCVDDIDKAREISRLRQEKSREKRLAPDRKAITLENLFQSLEAGKVTEIGLVVKTDVKGSLEVLRKSIGDLKHDEVKLKLIRDGVGGITEEDVLLAIASNAVLIGFRVVPDLKARKLVDENKVEIKTYRVIYELLEDLRLAMEGALKPLSREKVTGFLEIRQVFRSSRIGNIAGCFVTKGFIRRNCKVRLVRDSVVIYEGEIDSLKRFKDDQREVKEGYECGVKIVGYDDVKVGDNIEAFEIVQEKRTLGQDQLSGEGKE